MPLGEMDFNPAERRTRYFDFPINRTVSQLRVTVQDVIRGQNPSNSTSVYLPPIQIYGLGAAAFLPRRGLLFPFRGVKLRETGAVPVLQSDNRKY